MSRVVLTAVDGDLDDTVSLDLRPEAGPDYASNPEKAE